MKDFFMIIFIFYALKFKPDVIDNRAHPFWRWVIKELNKLRRGKVAFYFWKFGPVVIRDPFSHPSIYYWWWSDRHPFCLLKREPREGE